MYGTRHKRPLAPSVWGTGCIGRGPSEFCKTFTKVTNWVTDPFRWLCVKMVQMAFCDLYALMSPLKTFVTDYLLFLPGGLVILVARENDVLTIPEYKDRLEPLMKELEDERKWMMLERRVFPGYLTDIPGVVFVFRITK